MQFDDLGLSDGIWRGMLHAPAAPARLCVMDEGRIVADATLKGDAKGPWQVEAELPASVMSEGIRSLLLVVCDEDGPRPGASALGRLDLRAGRPLDQDLLAEIALLRAELDLLKREFRRYARRP